MDPFRHRVRQSWGTHRPGRSNDLGGASRCRDWKDVFSSKNLNPEGGRAGKTVQRWIQGKKQQDCSIGIREVSAALLSPQTNFKKRTDTPDAGRDFTLRGHRGQHPFFARKTGARRSVAHLGGTGSGESTTTQGAGSRANQPRQIGHTSTSRFKLPRGLRGRAARTAGKAALRTDRVGMGRVRRLDSKTSIGTKKGLGLLPALL